VTDKTTVLDNAALQSGAAVDRIDADTSHNTAAPASNRYRPNGLRAPCRWFCKPRKASASYPARAISVTLRGNKHSNA